MTTAKGGRPRWELTDERREIIRQAAKKGVKQDNIARLVGLSPTVWYEKKKIIPELTELLNEGSALGEELATTLLYQIWSDATQPKQLDALKFYLSRKQGWKEQVVEVERKQLPSGLEFKRVEDIDKEDE